MLATELSRRYVEALNSRDFQAFRELIDDHVHFYLATTGTLATTANEVIAIYKQAVQALPDVRIEIDSIVGNDEWSALQLRLVFNNRSERHAVFHRWIHDRLVYYHNYVDPSSLAETNVSRG